MPRDYLLCYKTRLRPGTVFLSRIAAVNDRFPAQTISVSKHEELCLPSLRVAAP